MPWDAPKAATAQSGIGEAAQSRRAGSQGRMQSAFDAADFALRPAPVKPRTMSDRLLADAFAQLDAMALLLRTLKFK